MLQHGSSRGAGVKLVRRNDRREIRKGLRLACQVVRERDFRLVAETTLDLSPNGMLVPSTHFFERGENMIVSFQATHLGLWFDTEATVARLVEGRRVEDRGVTGVALKFTTLDSVKRLILRGHLRRVPPPLPRRAQRIDWTATIRSI